MPKTKVVKKAITKAKAPALDLANHLPHSGDLVRVHAKIKEGDKERIQVFEGLILSVRGRGENKTMTVRHESLGMGVERIWPLESPSLAKVEVKKHGDFRRAKLYYLRQHHGNLAKLL